MKLAAYYLKSSCKQLAQVVFKDMQHEPLSRLDVIDELQAARADFWEFRDRGGKDFYYVEPELKPFLVEFFNWFERLLT